MYYFPKSHGGWLYGKFDRLDDKGFIVFSEIVFTLFTENGTKLDLIKGISKSKLDDFGGFIPVTKEHVLNHLKVGVQYSEHLGEYIGVGLKTGSISYGKLDKIYNTHIELKPSLKNKGQYGGLSIEENRPLTIPLENIALVLPSTKEELESIIYYEMKNRMKIQF